jgi:hypothetical protein
MERIGESALESQSFTLREPDDSSGAMVVPTTKDHLLGKAVFIAHYGC